MLAELPATLTEARALGVKRLFTSVPCKYGHLNQRRLHGQGSDCLTCSVMSHIAWWARQPHKAKLRNKYNTERYHIEPKRPCPDHCENCGKPPDEGRKYLNLDHDHITGEFRGWLCHSCNVGIGHLGDCVEGLEQAIEYLQRARCSRN